MIIGICGKSGSGKSTLARTLTSNLENTTLLDIDKIGHSVLTIPEVKQELINAFGSDILGEDNVDRKKLGEIVFDSRKEMQKLSDITWKYMQIEIDKFISSNEGKIIILDWILLPISKYFEMCDLKVLLDVPCEIRKERAMKRDNISEDKFDLREKASIDFNKKDFDYVLESSDEENIKRLVKSL